MAYARALHKVAGSFPAAFNFSSDFWLSQKGFQNELSNFVHNCNCNCNEATATRAEQKSRLTSALALPQYLPRSNPGGCEPASRTESPPWLQSATACLERRWLLWLNQRRGWPGIWPPESRPESESRCSPRRRRSRPRPPFRESSRTLARPVLFASLVHNSVELSSGKRCCG